MRRSIVAVAVALFGVAAIGTITPARATQPDPDGEHMVWVCHATAGEGELKNGYNLIYVDVASTQPNGSYHGENDHYGHATTSPKNNSKYGLLYDYLDVDPNNLPGKCGRPEMPSKDPVETLIGSEVDCDEGTVTETYEVTEYTYTWDGKVWVESETTTQEERSRDLTEEEAAACSTGEQPPMPSKDPIERLIGSVTNCEALTVTETFRVTAYTYTWDGEVWVESETTTDVVRSRNMTQAEAAACPTQQSQGPVPPAPPTVVGTAVTPVVATPVPEVPQAPAAEAPVAEAPAVAAAPAALPNTGSETWTIFLIGLATLLAGAGMVVLSRRSA